MKKTKGFTLVELLAVIVVLAIILIIAVPGVLSIINQTKNKSYESQLKMIEDAARNYVTSESQNIIWTTADDGTKKTKVTLGMLQSNGYLDKKLIDPRDKTEITCMNVNVTRDSHNRTTYKSDPQSCKPEPDENFAIEDGISYGYGEDDCVITSYYGTSKDIIIPSKINGKTVVGISTAGSMDLGFYYADLDSVILPNTLKFIDDLVFNNSHLTDLNIPNSVVKIGSAFNNNQLPDEKAFIYARNSDGSEDKTTIVSYGGARRDHVVIPAGVKTIGSGGMASSSLTSVEIPDSVTKIGDYAFQENRLETILIPDSVTEIGDGAFRWPNLPSQPQQHVVIGRGVMTIGSRAFQLMNNSTIVIKGKTSLNDFTSLATDWYVGASITVTFEP